MLCADWFTAGVQLPTIAQTLVRSVFKTLTRSLRLPLVMRPMSVLPPDVKKVPALLLENVLSKALSALKHCELILSMGEELGKIVKL